MIVPAVSVSKADIEAFVQEAAREAKAQSRAVLEAVGRRAIEYLQSYTEERSPPARLPGGGSTGPRQQHPTGWSDVTRDLVSSYKYEVIDGDGGTRLKLSNDSDHAVYLEQRDAFYVLGGVLDQGGLVEQALRAALAEVAPEWTVTGNPIG